MHGEVGQQICFFKVAEFALGLLPEAGGTSLGGIGDLSEYLVPRRLHLVDPLVVARQDRFGGRKVGCSGPKVGYQFFERFDLGKGFEPGTMRGHFRGVVAKILELAGRGVELAGILKTAWFFQENREWTLMNANRKNLLVLIRVHSW